MEKTKKQTKTRIIQKIYLTKELNNLIKRQMNKEGYGLHEKPFFIIELIKRGLNGNRKLTRATK